MKKRLLTDSDMQKFNAYLLKEERSPVTIEKYNRDIAAFRRYIGEREITKEAVIAYKQHLIQSDYAERSINSMLAAVNSLFRFLEWYDLRVKSIRLSPEVYRPEEKELTQKEYERLVNTALKQGKDKLAMILQTICATGIRIGELQYITVEAVRYGEAKVHSKGRYRKVFLVTELCVLLKTYARKNRITSGTIFLSAKGKPVNRTTVWKEMKSLCRAAGVNPSKVFPHNLRHLFARAFYKAEKDIAKLADILGHGSINTTRIYLVTTGKEHRRKMEKMGLVRPIRV